MIYQLKNKFLPILIGLSLVLLPTYIIRCKSVSYCVSPVPFTLLEVLIVTTILVWLVIKIRERKNAKKIIKEIREKIPLIFQIFFAVFLIAAGFNILISPDKIAALGIYKAYFVEPLLFFIVISSFLSETKNFRLIIWGLIVAGLWTSLLAIWEKLIGRGFFNPGEFLERGRSSAVYSTSNAVGLLVVPLIILVIGYLTYLYFEKREVKNEFFLGIVSLVILLLGQAASGSRGGYLGLFFGIVFFLGIYFYKKQNSVIKKWLFRGFIYLSTLFVVFNVLFFLNIAPFIREGSNNQFFGAVRNRLCLWQGSVELIKHQPLFGAGLAGFQTTNLHYRTCSVENQLYPHNLVLNFWVETGLGGMLSFLAICVFVFRKLLEKDNPGFLNIGLAAIFVSIFFHGLVDVPYFKNDLAVLFWVILALCFYQINESSFFKVRRLFIQRP